MQDAERALGETLARYRVLAIRFATGLAGDPDVAEDAYQEVVARLWSRVRRGELAFESEAHARNYILRALRNRCADLRRPEGPAAELDDLPLAAPGPAELAEAAEAGGSRSAKLAAALARLRAEERELLDLRYRDGLTYREIEARTGRAISTLQARVQAALAKLRDRIGKGGGAP